MPIPKGPRFGLGTTLSYIRNPYGFFERSVRRYGQPFGCHTMGGPLVLSGRPEDVRDIFRADPMIFEPWNTDAPQASSGEQFSHSPQRNQTPGIQETPGPSVSWPTNALIRTKYGFSSSRLRK
ncbi:MAG: hypothetical protein CM1200mP14_25280 [Gammaproteobacteria bacterium]|nr:MAG: hypothetical protein CM1200mP14_25280 [Gammaproteobacteria bacterium]